MPITTYIGAEISVTASVPTTPDLASFQALGGWNPCGQLVKWAATGDEQEDIRLSNMSGRIKHKSGDRDGGLRDFAFAYSPVDPGQMMIRDLSGLNVELSFRIADPDGNIEYFHGIVSNVMQMERSTSTYKGQTGLIGVNSPVITFVVFPASAPVNVSAPTISGAASVGSTLTMSPGAWSGNVPQTYSYQWLRGSTAISGATGATYLIVSGDIGSTISVRESAVNVIGSGIPKVSNPTAVVSGASSTTGIVGNRFAVPMVLHPNAIPLGYTSRRHHYAHPDGSITNLKCVDVHWWINSYPVAAPGSWSIKRYIEYPAGTFHQVLWSAASTLTLSAGSYKSDTVVSSVTGLALVIPAGAVFYERTVLLTAMAANTMPFIKLPAASNTLGAIDGNANTDLGNSGTINASTTEYSFGAAAMVGDISVGAARSFVLMGDSITWGSGDVTSVGPKGGSGYPARMLDVRGYPYTKVAQSGQTALNVLSDTTLMAGFISITPFSELLEEHGINDIRLNASQATLLSRHQSIYAMFSGKVINQTTITPRTDSTDGWATEANQATRTDGNMAGLTGINDAIRVPPANVTRVIDAADAAMSARNSNIWKAASTLDGTHPNSSRAAAMATALAPALG